MFIVHDQPQKETTPAQDAALKLAGLHLLTAVIGILMGLLLAAGK